MKLNKLFNKNNFIRYLSIIIVFFGSILLGIIFYIFIINKIKNSSELNSKSCSKCSYFHGRIKRTDQDLDWYHKQSKYIENGTIQPIEIESIKNITHPEIKIKRKGMLLITKNAKATILICHGFMTSKDDMGIMRHIFKGFNILTFDFRAHGEDTKNHECTLGLEEMHDVVAAAEFIKSNQLLKNIPLIVYGFSMGAVASIEAQSAYPNLFDCAIWDCPFESTNDLISRSVDKMKLSFFGYDINLPGRFFFKRYAYHPFVQKLFKFIVKITANMDSTQINTDLKSVSTKESIKKITIPMLIIACHNDEKAPPSAVLDVYNNANISSYKRYWISAGRKHFDAIFLNTEKYAYKIRRFIDNFLNGSYINKIEKSKIKEDKPLYEYLYMIE